MPNITTATIDYMILRAYSSMTKAKFDLQQYGSLRGVFTHIFEKEPGQRTRGVTKLLDELAVIKQRLEEIKAAELSSLKAIDETAKTMAKIPEDCNSVGSIRHKCQLTKNRLARKLLLHENGDVTFQRTETDTEIRYRIYDDYRFVEILYYDLLKIVFDRQEATLLSCERLKPTRAKFKINKLPLCELGDNIWDLLIQKAGIHVTRWIAQPMIDYHKGRDTDEAKLWLALEQRLRTSPTTQPAAGQ